MPKKKSKLDDVEELGLLLKAAMRESERRLNYLLRPLGLTAGQAEILQLLDRHGPMSLGELGILLVAEGGNPSRLVDRMVQAGYVLRDHATDDRRRIVLSPSEHGSRLAKAACKGKKEFREWVRSQVGKAEFDAARKFFSAFLAGTEFEKTVAERKRKGALA